MTEDRKREVVGRGNAKADAHYLFEMYIQGSCPFELLSVTNDGYGGLKFQGRISTELLPRVECRPSLHLRPGVVVYFRKNPDMSIRGYYASQERMLDSFYHVDKHLCVTVVSKDGEDFYMLENEEAFPSFGDSTVGALKGVCFVRELWRSIEMDAMGVENCNLKRVLPIK